MKKAWKILWRVVVAILVAVYCLVALANYSLVQSIAGAEAGRRLSKAWGGELKIGSLHADPFNHLIADNLLMVAPDGDTILEAKSLRIRFRKFPYSKNHLRIRRVMLRDAYYHLATWEPGDTTAPDYVQRSPMFAERPCINLQYIIDYYYTGKPIPEGAVFTVDVGTVELIRVHYKMDLPETGIIAYEHGVEIPHMEFFNIRSKIRNVHVVNDDVTCRLVRLSALERSGFEVDNISGQVHVGPNDITVDNLMVETDRSLIQTDVRIDYNGWESLEDYLYTAKHSVVLKEGTTVATRDIAYWAPVLWGLDIQLTPVGTADGTVHHLHTNGLNLRFGNASEIELAGTMAGLPVMDSLWFDLQDLELVFEESDITQVMVQMPKLVTPQVAEYLKQIQYIDLTMQARGSLYNEATANINMVCGLGNLRADIQAAQRRGKRHLALEANSDGMGLTLLGSDWLTHSGMSLNLEADLPKKINGINGIDATTELQLFNSVVRGNRLDPIELNASLADGNISIDGECTDSILNFAFKSHMKLADSLHGYHADITLNRFKASAFGLMDEKFGDIGTHIVANVKGNNVDELSGGAIAHNTHMGAAKLRELRVNIANNADSKGIQVESDVLKATLNGHFKYVDIPTMVQHICYEMLPTDLNLTEQPTEESIEAIMGNNMNFHVRLTDEEGLLGQLVPGLSIASGTRVDGVYNSSELLKLVARGESLNIGDLAIGNFGLNTYKLNGKYTIEVESSNLNIGVVELLDDVKITLSSNKEGADIGLMWGDSTQHTFGDILLTLDSGDISVVRPYFNVGESQWQLITDNAHLATLPHPGFEAKDIRLASNQQSIDARLRLMNQDNDCIELDFSNFDLGLPSDLILQDSPISLDGEINGHFSLYGLNATPYFNSNLTINDCRLNSQSLGDLGVRTNWNAEMNTLNLQVGGNTLHATGWLGMGGNDPELNFAVDFNRFELASIAPLLSTFSSRFEGELEGQLDISGTVSSPIVIGEAYVDHGALKVDITGVTYYFNDSIKFTNNLVSLNNFRIIDPLGNTATLDGSINYNSLSDIEMNLQLNTDNIMVLNQRDGDDFYGTLMVAAEGSVNGSTENLDIGLRARTNAGSTLTVPVTDRRQIKEQNFITFVGDENTGSDIQQNNKTTTTNLNIEVDLSITPDVQLNLPMNFSEVAVNVKGTGNGDLHMTIDGGQEPLILGNYEITSGSLKLGLASIIEKSFALEPGSSLNFQGSVPDTRFDLQAVYSQRVNLSTLTGSLSAVDNTQKYIQVENIIAIAGTLTEPTLNFDLRLPNSDASVEEEVFAYIDRNSERDMMNQTMSLLLMGSFYNVGGNMGDNNLLTNGLSSGYSMVASTMGNMVSDMVQIVDVDFKYKAATELTNEQVDVNISKDWGRWYLESTLGYGGDSRELQADANGNAVIDALIGYRITPLIHVYAYNRTNNNDYTRLDLPYKQGAGLKLTKDFDHWGDLFVRTGRKKTKNEK